jgi:hypothetical protein
MTASSWPHIVSEVLVNLGSAWLALAVVEPRIDDLFDAASLLLLTVRLSFGMVSLVLAKVFREVGEKNEPFYRNPK